MHEAAIQLLIDLVKAHYASSSEPFYLATAGQKLREARDVLVEKFGSLAGAVKHAGAGEIDVVTPAGQPGRTMVVTPEVRVNIEARYGDARAGTDAAPSAVPCTST